MSGEDEDYEDDFDAYSSDFESEDEDAGSHKGGAEAVVYAAMKSSMSGGGPTAAGVPLERAYSGPPPDHRQTEYYRTKILPLRHKCEEQLGQAKFEQVHAILRRRWVGECDTDEGEIKAALEAIVPPSRMNAVFLVDQLIFCEEHEK